MLRKIGLVAMVLAIVATSVPAFAADPSVSKSVLTDEDGRSVVVVSVSARGRSVYGISVKDASGSIQDIVAPDGWAAVATEDHVMFRTVDKPVRSGASVTFRIVVGSSAGNLDLMFRDEKSAFGSKKSI